MTLEPVIKIDKKNKQRQEILMITSFRYVVTSLFFPIFGEFAAIQKPDSGCMVYKPYIFNYNNLFAHKNWKQN